MQDFVDIKIHATYETSAMNSMDPNMMGMWGMGGASAAINGGVHGATGRPDPLLVVITVITPQKSWHIEFSYVFLIYS